MDVIRMGGYFGQRILNNERVRKESAIAQTDCELIIFDKSQFAEL